MGRGIEMVRDIEAYKDKLLTQKDKWGETAVKPDMKESLLKGEEVKEDDNEATKVDEGEEVKVDQEKEMIKKEKRENLHRLVQEFTNIVV